MTVTDDEGSQGRQRSALGREERAAQTGQAARRDSSGSSVILRLIRKIVKPGGAVDGVMTCVLRTWVAVGRVGEEEVSSDIWGFPLNATHHSTQLVRISLLFPPPWTRNPHPRPRE